VPYRRHASPAACVVVLPPSIRRSIYLVRRHFASRHLACTGSVSARLLPPRYMNGIVFSRFSTNAAFIKSGRKKTLVVAYLFSFGQAAEPLRSLRSRVSHSSFWETNNILYAKSFFDTKIGYFTMRPCAYREPSLLLTTSSLFTILFTQNSASPDWV
jgi:hypothetical protein